jgi:hypothetical protein
MSSIIKLARPPPSPGDDAAELQLALCAEPTHPCTSVARIMTPQPSPPLTVPYDSGVDEPAMLA